LQGIVIFARMEMQETEIKYMQEAHTLSFDDVCEMVVRWLAASAEGTEAG